jgi:hypothetical protein
MTGEESHGLEVRRPKLAHRRERLRSGSEVQRFRVEPRHRLLVKGLAASEAAELFDQFEVGPTVGGTDPNVDATL